MLNECIEFLTEQYDKSWEIIIVDDGSDDGTSELALRYVAEHGTDKIRLLKLKENRGKGEE